MHSYFSKMIISCHSFKYFFSWTYLNCIVVKTKQKGFKPRPYITVYFL